jgi:hypothetical protein
MESQHVKQVLLLVLFCIGSFAAGMYYSPNDSDSIPEDCVQDSTVQDNPPGFAPLEGAPPALTLPPTESLGPPAGSMPLTGLIKSAEANAISVELTGPSGQENKRIVIDGKTKFFLSVPEDGSAPKNASNPSAAAVPYVLKEGKLSDIKAGQRATVVVLNPDANEPTAERIIVHI